MITVEVKLFGKWKRAGTRESMTAARMFVAEYVLRHHRGSQVRYVLSDGAILSFADVARTKW